MLLLTALALFAASAVQAADIPVGVGVGGLNFSPTSVVAKTGDVVVFTFKGGAHTVTQSSFADPCTLLTDGVDSGPKPVEGATTPPTFNYTYTGNGTEPAWFYCKTTGHCKGGMVFAVNPTADKTFDAFKAKAQGGGSTNGTATTTTPAGGSGTQSGSAPASTSGAANGRASVGIGAVAAALLFGGINAL